MQTVLKKSLINKIVYLVLVVLILVPEIDLLIRDFSNNSNIIGKLIGHALILLIIFHVLFRILWPFASIKMTSQGELIYTIMPLFWSYKIQKNQIKKPIGEQFKKKRIWLVENLMLNFIDTNNKQKELAINLYYFKTQELEKLLSS